MAIEIGVIFAVIGCIIGVAGWLSGRDKSIRENAVWHANVENKLDKLLNAIERIEAMDEILREHEQKIIKIRDNAEFAHERLDIAGIP